MRDAEIDDVFLDGTALNTLMSSAPFTTDKGGDAVASGVGSNLGADHVFPLKVNFSATLLVVSMSQRVRITKHGWNRHSSISNSLVSRPRLPVNPKVSSWPICATRFERR